MTLKAKTLNLAAAAALGACGALATAASPVRADDAPAFAYTFNIGAASDYRFRGVSQTADSPAVQGGADLSYGIGYFGLWASNLDFGKNGLGQELANVELDIYGGIKPVLGPVTFDIGVIYYDYPGAKDFAAELDYVELKLGASGNLTKELLVGVTGYWSPDYTGETGSVFTVEGTAAYTLPKMWMFDPTLSGRIGYQKGDSAAYQAVINGSKDYLYWDAGVTLTVEKLALDFRYVDSDISNAGGFCNGPLFECDSKFVFTAKVTLP